MFFQNGKTVPMKIREPKEENPSKRGMQSLLIILAGIFLGFFAKWLDNLSIDQMIWWQNILGRMDLWNGALVIPRLAAACAGNCGIQQNAKAGGAADVFCFFAGMCTSYHCYTILFSGFNPKQYMKIWYGLTVLSPCLAYVCWYGKGKTWISLAINSAALAGMMLCCFSLGFWYFDCMSVINTLLFILSVVVFYQSPKQTAISLAGALGLSYLCRLFF